MRHTPQSLAVRKMHLQVLCYHQILHLRFWRQLKSPHSTFGTSHIKRQVEAELSAKVSRASPSSPAIPLPNRGAGQGKAASAKQGGSGAGVVSPCELAEKKTLPRVLKPDPFRPLYSLI